MKKRVLLASLSFLLTSSEVPKIAYLNANLGAKKKYMTSIFQNSVTNVFSYFSMLKVYIVYRTVF